MNSKSILIIGGSGFLGQLLVKYLADDYNITATYRRRPLKKELAANCASTIHLDLSDVNAIRAGINGINDHDVILLLAGNVDVGLSVKDPISDLQANTISFLHLLDTISGGTIIFISSGAVYGSHTGGVSPQTSAVPSLPYAISKLSTEGYVRYSVERNQAFSEYLIVRFFGAFGEFEPPHKFYRKVITYFQKNPKEPYRIYGDGTNIVDAMISDDFASAFRVLIKSSKRNITFDLSQHEPMSILDVCKQTSRALNQTPNLQTHGVTQEKNQFYSIDDTMQKCFNWKPKYSFKESIRKCISSGYYDNLEIQ